jgi:hypothetical protein
MYFAKRLTYKDVINAMPGKTYLEFNSQTCCIRDQELYVTGVPVDVLFECTRRGCTIITISSIMTADIVPILIKLARGAIPSVNRLVLDWPVQSSAQAKTQLIELIRSPLSSINCLDMDLNEPGILAAILPALECPRSRIRNIKSPTIYVLANRAEIKRRLQRCWEMHLLYDQNEHTRDCLVILLFLLHHHIVRQIKSFLL